MRIKIIQLYSKIMKSVQMKGNKLRIDIQQLQQYSHQEIISQNKYNHKQIDQRSQNFEQQLLNRENYSHQGLNQSYDENEQQNYDSQNVDSCNSQESNQYSQKYDEKESQQEKSKSYQQNKSDKEKCFRNGSLSNSQKRANESIDTFGNKFEIQKQLQITNKPKIKVNKKSELPISNLEQNDFDNSPNRLKKSQFRIQQLQNSSADDQINRIINKVLLKNSKNDNFGLKKQQNKQFKINKIDQVNQGLLRQNAELIEQIYQLEKKIKYIDLKNQNRSKIKQNSKSSKKDLNKRLKQYQQKIENAMNLHSKLSSRYKSQKSMLKLNSSSSYRDSSSPNTYKDNSSSLGKFSTVRCVTLKDDQGLSKRHSGKAQLQSIPICNKNQSKTERSPKQTKYTSPVLQFKNYEIYNSIKQQSLQSQNNQKSCPLMTIEQNRIQLQKLQRQQKLLDQIIKKNNRKIQGYQQILMRLVV